MIYVEKIGFWQINIRLGFLYFSNIEILSLILFVHFYRNNNCILHTKLIAIKIHK